MNMIDSFKGEYQFLSNFYQIPILHNDLIFPSVEHAYVASKSVVPEFWKFIKSTSNLTTVKREGRKIQLLKNWETIKLDVM